MDKKIKVNKPSKYNVIGIAFDVIFADHKFLDKQHKLNELKVVNNVQ